MGLCNSTYHNIVAVRYYILWKQNNI